MAQRAPSAPRGRRFYIKGIGAVADKGNGSFVFKTAPLRRSNTQTQAQVYATGMIQAAAWFTKLATAWEYQTAKDLAGRGGYTWKDMLISQFAGTAVEFTDSTGQLWTGRRILMADIQTLLDSIASAPGSILVRTPGGWAALYIGTPGYVLTIDPTTGLPDWKTPGGGGSATLQIGQKPWITVNTGYTQAINFAQLTPFMLQKGASIDAVAFYARTASTTTTLRPGIYDEAANIPNNLVASGPTVTGLVQGINVLPLSSPYVALFDQIVWTAIAVQTATFSAAAPNTQPLAWFACSGALPSTAPSTTFATGGNNLPSYPTKQ